MNQRKDFSGFQTPIGPGIGHNSALIDAFDIEAAAEQLTADNAELIKRRDDLLASCERMPAAIEDDEMSGQFADQKKMISAAIKIADDRRKTAKQPYLDGSRAVDGFFSKIKDPLERAKKTVDERQTRYLRKKAEEERQAREAAEREAREAALKAQREAEEAAQAAKDDDTLDSAIKAEEAARQAREAAGVATREAHAKPADMARTRGDYGSVASLRTQWTFGNLDRNKLDLEILRPYLPEDALEKAVRAFIRAGGRKCAGVDIFEDQKAV